MELLKRIISSTPGFKTLDRYLCQRYTGSSRRELYPRGHYYSPLPDIEEARSYYTKLNREERTLPGIDIRADSQYDLLKELAQFSPEFQWPTKPATDRRFYLDNPVFPPGDAFMVYAVFRHFQPKRVIEIGSGFSSALMLDINDLFLGSQTAFTFIEPYPDRLKELVGNNDYQRFHLVVDRVQNVAVPVFQQLESGDVLFIDSSHVSKIGSDVNYIFSEVLPALLPGVIIHFHDVYWPFEYPIRWIEQGRAWNEAYVLRAFLQYNQEFQILMFNSYVKQTYRSFLEEELPALLVEASRGGSIWLQKH